MVTYKPIKNIMIPLVAAIIGISAAIFFMPTKMDVIWKEWNKRLDELSSGTYEVHSIYETDDKLASKEVGIWSNGDSSFKIDVSVSDKSTFSFSVTIEGERLFILSGDEWRQSTTSERFTAELRPLDDPFSWIKETLLYADRVEKKVTNNKTEYIATFLSFDKVDFRSYQLEEQADTTLTMTIMDDGDVSIRFVAHPVRPDYLGLFDIYPEKMVYDMTLKRTEETIEPLPPEAYTSKGMDE